MRDFESYINLYRKQKHDFMNDIQVILGYIEIMNMDDAKKYIEKISDRNREISEIYVLGDIYLAFALEVNIRNLWRYEKKVEINIEINDFKEEFFKSDFDKKFLLVNNIFEELNKIDKANVYIYIFEDSYGPSLIISNSERLLDILPDSDNENKETGNISVSSKRDGEELAYRLTINN